jgi:hypothetical protein
MSLQKKRLTFPERLDGDCAADAAEAPSADLSLSNLQSLQSQWDLHVRPKEWDQSPVKAEPGGESASESDEEDRAFVPYVPWQKSQWHCESCGLRRGSCVCSNSGQPVHA